MKILRRRAFVFLAALFAVVAGLLRTAHAAYVGSASTVSASASIQAAATEILGSGGGSGSFLYKGGGNAVDAAVATALAACVVNPGNCSLGGYGGHIMIYKAGLDGGPKLVTCIDFNSAAGSLASSNMFVGSVNMTNGHWTGALPAANQIGWKAAGVPGTFAGLFMAQTNYGRKVSGTNYFPFAEILKPALARIANGDVVSNAYYTVTSVSNLVMDLYTNSVGYTNLNGTANPLSTKDPYAVFYSGDIAVDIAAAMAANGGLVTYADMTNYRPREVTPYVRHFNYANGTPATVYAAPLGASGISVLQQVAMMEALGWTNGPNGTWDSLHYWHARAEAARLMWKDHFQWLGDPGSGVVPPNFLRNGSTNFCDQLLAHATNGSASSPPSDPNETLLTNSLAGTIANAVDSASTTPIQIHWDDVRYGTRNVTTSDQWGNCVTVTLSMGGAYGAQVGLTNRALIFGQGMALFDARPGWPDSIAPGKRPVHNMCPMIIIPDGLTSPTNGVAGGRPPLALGGVGGSTIENNMAMQLMKYLMDPPSSSVTAPNNWMYNFEGNTTIYMRSGSYPAGVQSYLGSVGLTASGGPPSVGELSYVEAWVPPVMVTQPSNKNISSGSTVNLDVTVTGLPLFYQWFRNGAALLDGWTVSGAQTAHLTLTSVTNGAQYFVVVTNGAGSVISSNVDVTIGGAPAIVMQPISRTNLIGTVATFSVSAVGTGPLAYRWTKDGAPLVNGGTISGATNSTLNITNVSDADAGNYGAIVTNAFGNASSDLATLTIVHTPVSQPFLYEAFDYTNVGGPVSSNTPANWTYGGSGANDLSVVTGNLSYSGLATPMGNSVTNGGAGLGVRRLFGSSFNSGKLYFSALFRINDLGFGAWNGQSSVVGALTATDNTSFRLQVVIKSNSPAGYIIGTQKSGTGATTTFAATERHAGETVFLVGKYDFTMVSNAVSLWIDPDSATLGLASEPATGFIYATNGTDGFTIDRFNMRQNAASGSSSLPASMQWDELRFGLTWADVTPIGPLFSAVPRLSNLALSSNGAFQFIYTNNGNQTYSVFGSTNLTNWISLGAAVQTAPAVFRFTDLDSTNLGRRFYQLRSP